MNANPHTTSLQGLPSLKALHAFEAAARHLNFRLAAEELDVTQGAVAQQVRALEAELGVRLFERHARGLAPTEVGSTYALRVRRALEEIADATRQLRPGERQVTISVAPTLAAKWLLPRLPRFAERHPGTELRVLATERVSRFHAEGVDLSIRYGQPPFGPGLHVQRLLENTLIAVGSPALVGPSGTLPAKRLARLPLVHDAHGSWLAFFAQAGMPAPPPGGTRFNQISLAIDAAIAGQGLALASPFFVAPDIAAGRLVRVLPQVALRTGTDYHLVWPQRARGDGVLLDEVTAWLMEEAAREWALSTLP
ncbi:LysR substrate-binding domain-containing protein [Acidovorax sp.]|uniref:LysR substrate-binding domain-containing protein n=1 Tax=Acidovorax sp. TaxID=1872122 RepID=UPI003CFD99F6